MLELVGFSPSRAHLPSRLRPGNRLFTEEQKDASPAWRHLSLRRFAVEVGFADSLLEVVRGGGVTSKANTGRERGMDTRCSFLEVLTGTRVFFGLVQADSCLVRGRDCPGIFWARAGGRVSLSEAYARVRALEVHLDPGL